MLRVVLLASALLTATALYGAQSRTSTGDSHYPPVVLIQMAALSVPAGGTQDDASPSASPDLSPLDMVLSAPAAEGGPTPEESPALEGSTETPSPLRSMISNGPVADIGTHSPAANRRAADRYEILIQRSAWFRGLRMPQECASIEAPDLRQSCASSFGAIVPTAPEKIREMLAAR